MNPVPSEFDPPRGCMPGVPSEQQQAAAEQPVVPSTTGTAACVTPALHVLAMTCSATCRRLQRMRRALQRATAEVTQMCTRFPAALVCCLPLAKSLRTFFEWNQARSDSAGKEAPSRCRYARKSQHLEGTERTFRNPAPPTRLRVVAEAGERRLHCEQRT